MTQTDDLDQLGGGGEAMSEPVPEPVGGGSGPSFPVPPQEAIDHLRKGHAKDPLLANDFDEVFGPGSSAKHLRIGTSKLAREMQSSGEIDQITQAVQQRSVLDEASDAIGRFWDGIKPKGPILGEAGKLEPGERMPEAQAELSTAKKVVPIARSIAEGAAEVEKAADELRAPVPARMPGAGLLRIGSGVASVAAGATGAFAREQQTRLEHAEKMVRGEAELPEYSLWRASVDKLFQSVGTYVLAKPAEFAGQMGGWAGEAAGLGTNPLDNPVYNFGKRIEEKAKELFPDDRARQYEFATKVMEGLGSTAAFGGTGLVVRMLGAGERGTLAAIALSGAAGQVPDEFEKATKAIARGEATEMDRFINTLANIGLGATEVIPFAPAFAKKGAVGLRAAAKRAGEQAVEETAQEMGQQLGSNVAAKATYDPTQDPYEGVLEGGLVAGISGAAFGAGMSRATARAEQDEERKRKLIEQIRQASGKEQPILPEPGEQTEPARPDLPAMTRAPERSQAEIAAAPTFNDILSALPRDAAGHPDVAALTTEMAKVGATAWASLTPEQRGAIYQTFAPALAEAAGGKTQPAGAGQPEAQNASQRANTGQEPASRTELYDKFAEVLATKAKRSEWAAKTGVPQQQLQPLIEQAMKDGRLKMVRGQPVRTQQARQAAPKNTPAQTGAPLRTPAVQGGTMPGGQMSAEQMRAYAKQAGIPVADRSPEGMARAIATRWSGMVAQDTSNHVEHDPDAKARIRYRDALMRELLTGEPAPQATDEELGLKPGVLAKRRGGSPSASSPAQQTIPIQQEAPKQPQAPPTMDRATERRLERLASPIARNWAQTLLANENNPEAFAKALDTILASKSVTKSILDQIASGYAGLTRKTRNKADARKAIEEAQQKRQVQATEPAAEQEALAPSSPPPLSAAQIVETIPDRSHVLEANGFSDGLAQDRASRMLRSGQRWQIDDDVADGMRAVLARLPDILPAGQLPGFIVSADPLPNGKVSLAVELRGRRVVNTSVALREFDGVRAFFDPRINSVVFARFDLPNQLDVGLGRELWHEQIHVLRGNGLLDDATFGRLVAHARSLGVMEMDFRTFSRALGNPQWDTYPGGVPLATEYARLYSNRSPEALREAIDQEAVAHMTELLVSGVPLPLPDDIRAIYEAIENGSLVGGQPMFARTYYDPMAGREVTSAGTSPEAEAKWSAILDDIPVDSKEVRRISMLKQRQFFSRTEAQRRQEMQRVSQHYGAIPIDEIVELKDAPERVAAYATGTDANGNRTFGKGPKSSKPMYAFAPSVDTATGQSMRRDLDALGYYSQALEAARSLKQAKGTPEQMLAQLKNAGVKQAEIDATGLSGFLTGKQSVTRDEIVKHLETNRVGLKEVGAGYFQPIETSVGTIEKVGNRYRIWPTDEAFSKGHTPSSFETFEQARDAAINRGAGGSVPDAAPRELKWQNYSLDPSNPTYRETVIHLPEFDNSRLDQMRARVSELRAAVGEPGLSFDETLARRRAADSAASELSALSSKMLKDKQGAFRSGHFSEPNIVGHMMTSMTKHEGQPVYTIDQIQSDWGQKLRDGGVRDEAKIAEAEARFREAYTKAGEMESQRLPTLSSNRESAEVLARDVFGDSATWAALSDEQRHEVAKRSAVNAAHNRELEKQADFALRESDRLEAEWNTAKAAASGHPLVNTTDQWVNTTLRRAIRQAAEADAAYIAIPTGDTVLSYNPGDESGMGEFYGKIVPKNLRNLLHKLDKDTPAPQRIETLDTPTSGAKGKGFTLFPLTDKVKGQVIEIGQPMFAFSPSVIHAGRTLTLDTAPTEDVAAYRAALASAGEQVDGETIQAVQQELTRRGIGAVRWPDGEGGYTYSTWSDAAVTDTGGEDADRDETRATNERSAFMAAEDLYALATPGGVVGRDGQVMLLAVGIKGIKYLDRNSRRSGEGSYNYVLFDDRLVKITHKNGESVSDEEARRAVEHMKENGPPPSLTSRRNANLLFAFAGRRARTADLQALARAEQMEADGKDRLEIWQRTGWWRGLDNEWRWEIDDSGSAMTPDATKVLSQDKLDVGEISRGWSAMKNVLSNPEVYAAYPSIAEMIAGVQRGAGKQRRMDGSDERAGLYSPDRNMIAVSAYGPGWGRRIMLHEQQHVIQGLEGFAEGSSPAEAEQELQAAFADVDDPSQAAMLDGLDLSHDALQRYARSAGEVEARAVEKRRNMTAEQRRQRAPWLDYDVPEDRQIVRQSSDPMFAIDPSRMAARVKLAAELRAHIDDIRATDGSGSTGAGAGTGDVLAGGTGDRGGSADQGGAGTAAGSPATGTSGDGSSGTARRPIPDLVLSAVFDYLGDRLKPEAIAARKQAQGWNTPAWHATTTTFAVPNAFRFGFDLGFHVTVGSSAAANERIGMADTFGKKVSLFLHRLGFLTTFGDHSDRLAEREEPRSVMALSLRVSNPLRLPDLGEWENPTMWKDSKEAADLPKWLQQWVRDWVFENNAYREVDAQRVAYNHTFGKALTAEFERRGHDAVVYKNIAEDKGKDSMWVWNPRNVRSSYDAFDERAANDEGLQASLPYIEQDIRDVLNGVLEEEGLASQPMFAFTPHLDMSQEARKARAEEMGFDTSRVWYHGTPNDFNAFSTDRFGSNTATERETPAIFLTTSPKVASGYAEGWGAQPREGARVIPTYVKLNNMDVWELGGGLLNPDLLKQALDEAKSDGRDGVIFTRALDMPRQVAAGGEASRNAPHVVAVFDPRNIRSVNAAFDPAQSDSANLMYAIDPTRIRRSDDSLDAAIERLKAAIGLTTVQGLRSMTLRAGNTEARVIPGPEDVAWEAIQAHRDWAAAVAQWANDVKDSGNVVKLPGEMEALEALRDYGEWQKGVIGVSRWESTFGQSQGTTDALLAARQKSDAAWDRVRQITGQDLSTPLITAFSRAGFDFAHPAMLDHPKMVRKVRESIRKVIRAAGVPLSVSPPPTPPLPSKGTRFGNTWITSGTRAQYDNYSGVARMRTVRQIDEIAHEGAHHLERLLGKDLLDIQRNHAGELSSLTIPGAAETPSEQWAEWFRLYVVNPQAAQIVAPQLQQGFEDLIEAEFPGMLEQLGAVQDQVEAYHAKSPLDQVSADLVSTHRRNFLQTAYGSYRDGTLKGDIGVALSKLYTATLDRMNPIWKLTSAMLEVADSNGVRDADGKPISIRTEDNPYKRFRAFAGSYKRGHNWLTQGIRDPNTDTQVAPALRDALAKVFSSEERADTTAAAIAGGAVGGIAAGPLGAAIGGTIGSALYGKASDAMRKTGWDKKRYQDFNAYIMSISALERYRQYEEKQQTISDLTQGLNDAAAARPTLADRADKDSAMLDRRMTAAVRLDTLLKDRRRALQSANTELRNAAKGLDAKKNDLLAAQMARDEGLAGRRGKGVASAEETQREAVKSVEELTAEVDELEVQQAILQSEIDQLTTASDASANRVKDLDEAVDQLREMRKRELGSGIHRPPVLEPKTKLLIAKAEAEARYPSFPEAAQIFHEYVHGLLVMEYRAGFHTAEQFAALEANKLWYAPLMRDMTDVKQAGGMQPGGRKWTPHQALKGSDRAVINPVDVIIERSYSLARKMAFDAGVKSIVNLTRRVGPGHGAIAEEVSRTETLTANQAAFDRIVANASALGLDEVEAKQLVQMMEHETTASDLQLIFGPSGKTRGLRIPYWENGERKLLQINDVDFAQEIFDSVNGLGAEFANWFVNLAASPSRALSFGVTAHPAFAIVNMARDMIAAWIHVGAAPIVTQARGIAMELSTHKLFRSEPWKAWSPAWIQRKVEDWNEFVRSYHDAGGIRGGQFTATMSGVQREGDWRGLRETGFHIAWNKVWDLIELSETSTRLGVARAAYKRAKAFDPTLSDTEAIAEAAYTARDVLDFDRKGSKLAVFSRLVAFLNPNLQGMDKAVRSATGMGDRGSAIKKYFQIVLKRDAGVELSADEERQVADAFKFWQRTMAFSALVTAAYMLYAGDPEEDEINDRMKTSHVMLDVANIWHNLTNTKLGRMLGVQPAPKNDPDWRRAPLPLELATPAIISIWALRTWRDQDPEAYKRLWSSLYDLLAPPSVPQVVKLTAEPEFNYSTFSGRPIVGEQLQKLPPAERYEWFTSSIAKRIGKALDVAPVKVDYVITNGLGYIGREIQRFGEWALPEGKVRPSQEESMLTKRIKADPYRGSNAMTEYYQQMKPDGGGGTAIGVIGGLMRAEGARYVEAASAYKRILDEQNPTAAKIYIANQPDELKAYAYLQAHYPQAVQLMHPLNRLDKVIGVVNRMQREIMNGDLKEAIGARKRRNVTLETVLRPDPQEEEMLADILNRVKVSEARNTFIGLEHGRWKGSNTKLPTDLVLDELKVANEKVYDELVKRIQMSKVPSLDGSVRAWRKAKPDLLQNQENATLADASGEAYDGAPQLGTRESRLPARVRALAH